MSIDTQPHPNPVAPEGVHNGELLPNPNQLPDGVAANLGGLSLASANREPLDASGTYYAQQPEYGTTFKPDQNKKSSYLDKRDGTSEPEGIKVTITDSGPTDKVAPLDMAARARKALEKIDAQKQEKAAKEEFAKDDNSWMQRMSETAAKRTDKADYRRRQGESLKVLAERKATRKGEETEYNKLKWQLGEGVVNLDPKKYRAMAAENYASKKQAAAEAAEQKEADRRAHLLSLAKEQRDRPATPRPDAETRLLTNPNSREFKRAAREAEKKLDEIYTALQDYSRGVKQDGRELTDADKLAIRKLVKDGERWTNAYNHYDLTAAGVEDKDEIIKTEADFYKGWSANLFNGVDLRTNEEQVVDTHNELRDLAQKYADIDTENLSDAEVDEIKTALTGYSILRDANPGIENPALTEGTEDILSLTAKYDRAKARTAIPIGTDDIPRRQQGNEVNGNQAGNSGRTRRFGRPGRRQGAHAHHGAQTPAGAAAFVDDAEGANRRPTMRERMRGHGRSAIAATAALLATAGLVYTGLNRDDYDPATLANARASAGGIGSESGEQGTGGSTTKPASEAENRPAGNGTISEQEQTFREENRYPWNRVDTLIKEMGADNLSAMNLMESRMPAAKENGFDFLKVDQPGHGTGDKSTNTVYFLVRPDGTITDNVNEIMDALNLSTELQIRNAINNAK